jgi:hypothetical protein
MDMTDVLSRTLDDNAELRQRVAELETALANAGAHVSQLCTVGRWPAGRRKSVVDRLTLNQPLGE